MKLSSPLGLAALASCAAALDVDLDSPTAIKAAAKTIAANLYSYYQGDKPGNTPGILPGPPPAGDYYWWEGGAMWGTFIDYWHFTQDTTYNNVSEASMVFQAGAPSYCYMPANVTMSLGNDDQGFWGLSAMLAAEVNFQNPPASQPQWLALAQAVWNTQAAPDRHDDSCGGGLRWQIPLANNGYNYKNSIANGIFFNMGARLARYTGNDTYAQVAEATWNWVEGVGFMSSDFEIYDGAHTDFNCTDISKAQFSYNNAVFLQGAAFMYNYTNGSSVWQNRVQQLTDRAIANFFPDGIAVELSCELASSIQCTTDMLSFKGYVHRWLAASTQIAPFIKETVMATLKTSAAGAMTSCDTNGVCGFRWTTGSYDGNTGAGQQMNALAALLSLLIDEPYVKPPLTNTTGATSVGNPSAGLGNHGGGSATNAKAITGADRAGAGILTALSLSSFIAACVWLTSDMSEHGRWYSWTE